MKTAKQLPLPVCGPPPSLSLSFSFPPTALISPSVQGAFCFGGAEVLLQKMGAVVVSVRARVCNVDLQSDVLAWSYKAYPICFDRQHCSAAACAFINLVHTRHESPDFEHCSLPLTWRDTHVHE